MGAVTDTFRQRWRSREHVGEARPRCVGRIRTGEFTRGYQRTEQPIAGVHIPGSSPYYPWQKTWEPTSSWADLPNVRDVSLEQDFEGSGITVATITIDNIVYTERTGLGGVYHLIERGYLAPFRGYRGQSTRPFSGPAKNEWYQRLTRKAEIYIEQGYGDELAGTFKGLIDDIDLDSSPTTITITARGFGGATLVDQRLFGHNKDPHIKDPVTFADRLAVDDTKLVGGGAAASSSRGGHPPRFVTDKDGESYWLSDDHDAGDVTEWVQVRVPRGRYESVFIDAHYAGMECFIGVFGRAEEDTIRVDGEQRPEGWVDTGDGEVPGANGGWHYIRHVPNLTAGGRHVALGHTLQLGDDSVFRVGFRNLARTGGARYRAGVVRLQAVKRKRSEEAIKGNWILVNDVADVVRVVLRWAGFKEWEIEDTGVRLKEKATFNRSSYLMDIIKQCSDKTGFVFFVRDGDSPDSLGVPIFRANGALVDRQGISEVRDTDLLTGLQVHIGGKQLPFIIRVRGKEAPLEEGGRTVGSGATRRLMGVYRPPWTRQGRLAGIITHELVNRFDLTTQAEVKFGCFLIALAYALESVTATCEVPGTPEFDLDGHVGLVDTGTGVNTRMWVARRSSQFNGGPTGTWKTTLGGSLIDTPDVIGVRRDARDFFAKLPFEQQIPVAVGGQLQPITGRFPFSDQPVAIAA